MSPTPEISSDRHSFMLGKDLGEGLELTTHDDGGLTIATAFCQNDFWDVTQASLTREQALELFAWLSRALDADPRS